MAEEKKMVKKTNEVDTAISNQILKIENKVNTELEWSNINVIVGAGNVSDNFPNFDTHKYSFSIDSNATKKTFFFANPLLSHYVAITQSTKGNGIEFKIARTDIIEGNDPSTNLYVLLLAAPVLSKVDIPFKLAQPTVQKDIIVKNGYDWELYIKGSLNANNNLDAEIGAGAPNMNIGKLNIDGFMNFHIFGAPFNSKITIGFGGISPEIMTLIRKKVTKFKLQKNSHQPNTINITIEPDIP
jgi:hypothetical protein